MVVGEVEHFFYFFLYFRLSFHRLKLLVRRDLEIIYFFFFCMLCFHVLAHLSVARHFLPTLHCVFLLASCLVQGNQKMSLPALSTSSIFYDPSICNLMVLEFPLPKLTLGKMPFIGLLGDPWAITLKQSSPCFELQTTLILYYSVCCGEMGRRRGVDSSV